MAGWTPEEDQVLIDWYPKLRPADVHRKLQPTTRSISGMKSRAAAIGLSAPENIRQLNDEYRWYNNISGVKDPGFDPIVKLATCGKWVNNRPSIAQKDRAP